MVRLAAVVGACGTIVMLLLYQVPARHTVDIGGYDAAYVRGFHDAHYANASEGSKPYLQGSDGSARWSRAQSFLLFPQAGLPSTVTLRMRGWREHSTPPVVHIFLNGHTHLATVQTSTDWETYSIAINGGLLKPHDVVLDIRSPTTVLPGDKRHVGVLLDRATYTVAPRSHAFIIPYPAQVCYGALAIGLWWLYTHRQYTHDDKRLATALRHGLPFALVVGVLFLLCYRLQPPFYPYPVRWLLPGIDAVLLGALVLRHVPPRIAQRPASITILIVVAAIAWLVAVLTSAHSHVTLSVPGVEKDFRVFATRATSLDAVLQADGFYHLGYPFLLWLIHPLTQGNVFLAARVIAAASGAILLLSGAWLAYQLFKHACNDTFYAARGSLLALLIIAGSSLTVKYALYVGSDMPFAALTTLSLALFVWAMPLPHPSPLTKVGMEPPSRQERPCVNESMGKNLLGRFLAGVVAGFAFLMRHPGLVLLPWGVLVCLLSGYGQHSRRFSRVVVCVAPFIAGCLFGAMPQLAVNMLDTGQLLYSQQAKNIWLAVYGNIDWNRWYEVPNSIGLAEIILRDPVRFAANWWRNIVGFIGSGAQDTSEFGQAIQLRLIGWPANWLAIVGLVRWLIALVQAQHFTLQDTQDTLQDTQEDRTIQTSFSFKAWRFWRVGGSIPRLVRKSLWGFSCGAWTIPAALLLFLILYGAAVCIGFILPRFFLPFVAVYAVAAAWVVQNSIFATGASMDTLQTSRRWIIASSILLILAYQGFTIGTRYVLTHQPEDERLVIAHTLNTLQPGEKVLVRAEPGVPLDRYSALAHAVAPWPDALNTQSALAQAREQGIAYVVWDVGTYGPPPLPNPQAAWIGPSGQYGLYRLGQ